MHVVATAGHVDHGKSTLVAALTGTHPDRLAEEKRRGLTIDLGFAATVLPSGREISFVDVPGHANFIENMLAGVGVLRECLFVVSASEGWKPQSEEHLRILELFGFSRGVIAITKVDVVDEEVHEIVRREISEAVEGTFLDGAIMIATDARHHVGIESLRRALDEVVATESLYSEGGRPRLWIDRSFSVRGTGNVITGTLTGGGLTEHDLMDLIPMSSGHSSHRVRVRSLQVHNKSLPRVAPGHRVAANITGLEHKLIGRGQALVHREQWAPTKTVDASLRVLASLDHEVSRRGAYQAFIGSAHHPIKLRILGDSVILPGGSGLVRLHFPTVLPLVRGDRYVLRESGRSETVGGGEVLDVEPTLPASKARPDGSLDRLVAERGWVRVEHLEKLTGERYVANVGDQWRVHPPALEQSKEQLRAMVAGAGPLGLDVRKLDARARALLSEMSEFVTDGICVRGIAEVNRDPLADHPYIAMLDSSPFNPSSPDEAKVKRGVLDELVRRGLILKWEDFYFPNDVVARAGEVVAELLLGNPNGVSVAQVREKLGTSRRFALPLLRLLDANGVTRRRGDVRIAGPRLPPLGP